MSSKNFEGKCIVVSAPSGAGKTTLVHYLLECDLGLAFSVSATNRPKRLNEKNKKDYHFLSTEEFKKLISEDAFAEWEEVYKGRYYGTLKSEIERIWKNKKHVIFDVDVVGGLNLKKTYKKDALAIFVSPGDISNLELRLEERGTESEADFKVRMSKAKREMKKAAKFDVIVLNENLRVAKKEIKKIVKTYLRS